MCSVHVRSQGCNSYPKFCARAIPVYQIDSIFGVLQLRKRCSPKWKAFNGNTHLTLAACFLAMIALTLSISQTFLLDGRHRATVLLTCIFATLFFSYHAFSKFSPYLWNTSLLLLLGHWFTMFYDDYNLVLLFFSTDVDVWNERWRWNAIQFDKHFSWVEENHQLHDAACVASFLPTGSHRLEQNPGSRILQLTRFLFFLIIYWTNMNGLQPFFLTCSDFSLNNFGFFRFLRSLFSPRLGESMFVWMAKDPNGPHFSPELLGLADCFGQLGMLMGTLIFNRYMRKWKYRNLVGINRAWLSVMCGAGRRLVRRLVVGNFCFLKGKAIFFCWITSWNCCRLILLVSGFL